MRLSRLLAIVLIAAMAVSPAELIADQQRATVQPAATEPHGAARNHTHDEPAPFSTNGCSGFREAKFFSCCYAHDLAYWAGGTRGDRRARDLELRQCLIDIGGTSLYDEIVADIGYFLVRLWAAPSTFIAPFLNDGWGRAWQHTKRGRYDPLTFDQQRVVLARKQQICSTLTLNRATGRYRLSDTREIALTSVRQICGPSFRLPQS